MEDTETAKGSSEQAPQAAIDSKAKGPAELRPVAIRVSFSTQNALALEALTNGISRSDVVRHRLAQVQILNVVGDVDLESLRSILDRFNDQLRVAHQLQNTPAASFDPYLDALASFVSAFDSHRVQRHHLCSESLEGSLSVRLPIALHRHLSEQSQLLDLSFSEFVRRVLDRVPLHSLLTCEAIHLLKRTAPNFTQLQDLASSGRVTPVLALLTKLDALRRAVNATVQSALMGAT